MDKKTSWIKKLEQRWDVTKTQVFIILLVFACTGTTVLLLKEPVLSFWVGPEGKTLAQNIIYLILILPIYNVFLLIYGFIFGQFRFFWEYEKKFFNRIIGNKKK